MESTGTALATGHERNIYESLALRGDLSGLKAEDKVVYLQKLCESLGLNPLTQPFIPLKLNGKEILYASKAATDQLASLHKLTREIVKTDRIEDVVVVTCRVTSPDGRFDVSSGAVTIGNLKGDALANAIMKAETKAKRRATLSFCGLGFLDESELETIPASRVQQARTAQIDAKAAELTEEEKLMQREIVDLLTRIGKQESAGMAAAKFERAEPLNRPEYLYKTRLTAIKTVLADQEWDTEEAATYLEQFGVEALENAADEQLTAILDDMRSSKML